MADANTSTSNVLDEKAQDVADSVIEVTNWLIDNQNIIIGYLINIAVSILILIIGAYIARLFGRVIGRVTRARNVDLTVSQFLSSLGRYTILTFVVLAAMSNIGIQTTSFVAIIGAAGLAVGLALQGALSNFASGVLLVIFRPFKNGEYVDLGGIAGTVESIQIFSTTLLMLDGTVVVVPNGKVIAGNIINYTREPNRRIEMTIGVSYSADVDDVKRILSQVIDAEPRVIKSLGTTVRLNELADSSLNFIIRVWTTNENFALTTFDLREAFKRELDRNSIEFPYPQMDIHVHKQINN